MHHNGFRESVSYISRTHFDHIDPPLPSLVSLPVLLICFIFTTSPLPLLSCQWVHVYSEIN